MRIGVVGLAGIGAHHLKVLSGMNEFELVAACDINPAVLEDRTRDLAVARYTDAEEMMDRERLDAVSLCTPPKVHVPHTELAAQRGIHVLAEKPMAPTPEACQAMIDACAAGGVVLMVAHKKRYVPAVARLRQLIDTDLGQPEVLYHRYPHPWMSEAEWFWAEDDGGGPLLENAVHAADTVRFLLGDIERLYAEGDVFNAPQRAPQLNCAVYTVRAANGAIGMIGAGMIGTPSPGLAFEDFYIACERGTAQVSGDFDNPAHLRYALRDRPAEVHSESFTDGDPFVAEFRHFAECVREGKEPLTSGSEGKKAIELCMAVKQSARTRQPVVLPA